MLFLFHTEGSVDTGDVGNNAGLAFPKLDKNKKHVKFVIRVNDNLGALMNAWTFNDVPDLTGRTAVVAGANSSIGLVTARTPKLCGTDPDAGPGSYWGLARLFEFKAPSMRARINELAAQDGNVAKRLCNATEKLIGLRFDLSAQTRAAVRA
jgi:hypothetical protein